MGKKLLKSGKVVIMLSGRHAGKKAIIVKTLDDGAGSRKFAHAIVAGIERGPKKITRSMGKKKQANRSRVKPFVRFVNFNHILPTRYNVELDVKKLQLDGKDGKEGESITLDESALKDKTQRDAAKSALKKIFEQGYKKMDEKLDGKGKVGEVIFACL